MFNISFFEVMFRFLIPAWMFRLLKAEITLKSVKAESQNAQQVCHESVCNPKPKVTETESHQTRESPDELTESHGGPTVPVLPEPTDNNAVIISELKEKLKSLSSDRNTLMIKNRQLKQKLISTERSHSEEIQILKWTHEDLESELAAAKLQHERISEQNLQYRTEMSKLREMNTQLTHDNQHLGVNLVSTQTSLASAISSLEECSVKNETLEKEVIDLKEKFGAAQSRIWQMRRDWRCVCRERLDLQRKNVELREKITCLEETSTNDLINCKELAELHAKEISFLRDFHAVLREKRNAENEELKAKVRQLEDDNNATNLQIDKISEFHSYTLEQLKIRYKRAIGTRDAKLKGLEETNSRLLIEIERQLDDQLEDHYQYPDYYRMLKLQPTATAHEIKLAICRKLNQGIHPDKQHSDLTEDIREKLEAKANKLTRVLHRGKEIFLDKPELRRPYDNWLKMIEFNYVEGCLNRKSDRERT